MWDEKRIRDAGGDDGVFDGDVGDVVAGHTHQREIVTVPVALQGEDVIGGAKEAVADGGVAAAEPVHAVLVGVVGIAADYLDVIEADVARVAHLDLPASAARDAGDAVDLDVVGFIHDDDVPVGLMHPALVIVGVLRPVVENDPGAEDADVVNLPDVERAEDDRAGRQIDGIAGVGVDVLVMCAGTVEANVRRCRGDAGGVGRVGEEEEKVSVGEVVAWARDGELRGAGDGEGDGCGEGTRGTFNNWSGGEARERSWRRCSLCAFRTCVIKTWCCVSRSLAELRHSAMDVISVLVNRISKSRKYFQFTKGVREE